MCFPLDLPGLVHLMVYGYGVASFSFGSETSFVKQRLYRALLGDVLKVPGCPQIPGPHNLLY